MRSFLKRCTVLLLCLCLLPAAVFAEGDVNDGTPVTRSDFVFSLHLNADAWPKGDTHFSDWERFLSGLSVRGTVDTQSFLDPYSRVYMNAGLYVKERNAIPFEYDGYHSFRYFRSPAIAGAGIHFQMFNFFQFMLKGYYFMGLNTQQIAPLLYPEATTKLIREFVDPIAELTAGEGERHIESDELYELAAALDEIALEDERDHIYYYFTCLLIELGANETVAGKLTCIEDLLDTMDPDMLGLSILPTENGEVWTLGENTVFTRDASGFTLHLADSEGYELNAGSARDNGEEDIFLKISLEGEERISAELTLNVPEEESWTELQGCAVFTLGGQAFWEEPEPVSFSYSLSRSASELPKSVAISADYIHPETGKEAIGFTWQADMQDMPIETIHDRPIDNQDDFFHLNESYLAEYKERFMPTLITAAIPVLLETPSGVISDIVRFMEDTGFMAFIGVE